MKGVRIGLGMSGGRQIVTPNFPLALFGASILFDWAFDPSKVTLDGSGNISSVVDLSGNGRTLSQGTAANRPGFGLSGGHGYGSFAGAQFLVTAALTVAQPVEVFAIAQTSVSAPGGSCYLIDFGSNVNILFQNGGALTISQFDGSTGAVVTVATNADFLLDSLFSGASSQSVLNGGSAATGSPGTGGSSATAVTVGEFGGGGSGWQGRIKRLFAISRAATAGERASVHTGAQSGYGTP